MRGEWMLTALIALSACGRPTIPGVEIMRARSSATPPGATVAAVYAELRAAGGDELLGGETPVAEKVEMHATTQQNGMMHMRPAPTVVLPAGESVEFAPGGLHFMLVGLREPLVAPSRFRMTLQFKNAGDVAVEVAVVAPGEMQH